MSGKSRVSKQKHITRSKRRKGKQISPQPVAQQRAVAPTHEAVADTEAAIPPVKVSTPKSATTAVPYPYIVGELRGIGILAGIVLVILVVLALVLS